MTTDRMHKPMATSDDQRAHQPIEKQERDVFDFVGERVAIAFLDTYATIESSGFTESLKAGATLALEECWFRLCGQHMDWEEIKLRLKRA